MDRRGFLGSILALGAAPAIVRADSLMKLWTPQQALRFHPDAFELTVPEHNGLLTIDMIKRECLRIMEVELDLTIQDAMIYGSGAFCITPGNTIKIKRVPRSALSNRRYRLA